MVEHIKESKKEENMIIDTNSLQIYDISMAITPSMAVYRVKILKGRLSALTVIFLPVHLMSQG